VMWVCNLCRKQQEILTKSGAWFFGSGPQQPSQNGTLSDTATGAGSEVPREKKARLQERSRSQTPLSTAAAPSQDAAPPGAQPDRSKGAEPSQPAAGPEQKQAASRSRSEPPRERKKTPGLQEQNGRGAAKIERKRAPRAPAPGEGPAEERERRERRESRRLEKGRSQDYPDGPEKREHGRAADDAKPSKEEEYQTRYRSDPNLARYPAKREKVETMLRNDSLSSDQSESVRPSPPKPHRSRRGGKKRQMSVSSSEEEGVSTPEYTSCEDVELESESVSEKGEGAGARTPAALQGACGVPGARAGSE
ncbi:hypothetical protein HPG69_002592, partial [Diceros bicornis minor]